MLLTCTAHLLKYYYFNDLYIHTNFIVTQFKLIKFNNKYYNTIAFYFMGLVVKSETNYNKYYLVFHAAYGFIMNRAVIISILCFHFCISYITTDTETLTNTEGKCTFNIFYFWLIILYYLIILFYDYYYYYYFVNIIIKILHLNNIYIREINFIFLNINYKKIYI